MAERGKPEGPLADFCAQLKRLVTESGLTQHTIAQRLGRSDAAISDLLNGRIKRAPEWDSVEAIVGVCAARAPAPGRLASTDPGWWRTRYSELLLAMERMPETPGPTAPRSPAPDPPELSLHELDPMNLQFAIRLLAGPREHLADTVEALVPSETAGGDLRPFAQAIRRHTAELLDALPERVRRARGLHRIALVNAVGEYLAFAAFFKVLPDAPRKQGARGVSLRDLLDRLLESSSASRAGSMYPRHMYRCKSLESSYAAAFTEYMEASGSDRCLSFARKAVEEYDALLWEQAERCPELFVHEGLHEDLRAAHLYPELDRAMGLSGLGSLLAALTGGRDAAPECRALSGYNRRVLGESIAAIDRGGPHPPTLSAAYVNPSFRISDGYPGSLSSDAWWTAQPEHTGIQGFLAGYLLQKHAVRAPLLVLGDPGSGKSLLTKLLAALLPAADYIPIRVELRRVSLEHTVQEQIAEALHEATGERGGLPELVRSSGGGMPVVMLDGFDELIQATANSGAEMIYWDYLQKIAEFQEAEAARGRPVYAVVTSRTVVADEAELPHRSQVIQLAPFDESRITRWLEVWNQVNRGYFAENRLSALDPQTVLRYQDLASQPLLLLMLALYDSIDNKLLREGDRILHRVDLYERLLTEFARRQVIKEFGPGPPAATAAAVERELDLLSTVAIGMFNRGRQSILEGEADADLSAYTDLPGGARLIFNRFFFVMHQAQAVVSQQVVRSYEFLHATFGEYLVARKLTEILRRVVEDWPGPPQQPDDGLLRALFSFTPLSDRAQVVENLHLLIQADPAFAERTHPLLERLCQEALRGGFDLLPDYCPKPATPPERHAVHSANLVVLALATGREVFVTELLATSEPAADWRRLAMLWKSQLSKLSWDATVRSVLAAPVRRRLRAGEDAMIRDLQLISPSGRISTLFMAAPFSNSAHAGWHLDMAPGGELISHWEAGPDDTDLIAHVSLLHDRDLEILLHAVLPFLRAHKYALRTFVADDDAEISSVASLLLSVVVAEDPLAEQYERCARSMAALPAVSRDRFLSIIARLLRSDIARLPQDAALTILKILLAGQAPGLPSVGYSTETLADLTSAIMSLLGGRDGDTRQVLDLLGSLHNETSARRGKEIFLMFGEATATRSFLGDASAHLDWLVAQPDLAEQARRQPRAVIGMLRLARELGRTEWIDSHAPRLLSLLPESALELLLPSDVAFLLPAMADHPDLARALTAIEARWR